MRKKKYAAPCVQEYHLMEESDLLAGTGEIPPVLKPGESTENSGDGFAPNTSKEYTWKDMIDDWEKDRER